MRVRFALFAGAILGVFVCQQAHAVITAKTPLSSIEGSAKYVFVGKVEKYISDKPAMAVTITEDIKGKAPFRKLPINLKVDDPKAFKEGQIEPLLKRFGPDLEIIFFVAEARGDLHITRGFCNGTWFSLNGTIIDDKADQVLFVLASAEPFFRKSFKGTTEELRKLMKDFSAKKAKLPALNDKEPAGFGPEYGAKKGALGPYTPESLRSSWGLLAMNTGSGHLFGVIPTIGLGAPLAILALLFPTVFGGVFVLFRQWLAFITLLSINSTVLILQWYLAEYHKDLLRGTWWSDGPSVWFLMTIFTFLCAFWAWRRQLNALSDGEFEAPPKTELAVLAFMAAGCLVTMIILWCLNNLVYRNPIRWSDVGWTLTVVMTIGICAGMLYRAWSALEKPAAFGSMPLATEGVILCAMLLGHVAFVPAIFGSSLNTDADAGGKQKSDTEAVVVKKWEFSVDVKAMFASSPVIDGDSIYASYSETALRAATLVKLDRQTGLQKWKFVGKKGELREMISTPCIADGKLYFGEGFHDDPNCKVYCVDADTGKEVWSFTTGGQTESSPAVANGKLYIGAGNEGVYCFDAKKSIAEKKGVVLWKFPPADYKGRLLRFGGGMNVVGTRLYCGSAVDRNEEKDKGETAAFCLDADTGKQIWKAAMPYPVWSTPVVKDGFVYVTTGNGDVFDDAKEPEKPGGALLCLKAGQGEKQWEFKVPNGIIESPVIDAGRLYFGCRDGVLYCVGRADGKERWRHFLDAPIIGTPVLDTDAAGERTFNVFACADSGKVGCFNPQNGDMIWSYKFKEAAYISTSPRLSAIRTKEGFRRQLFFGAGVGGGKLDLTANRPVFFCLEDLH